MQFSAALTEMLPLLTNKEVSSSTTSQEFRVNVRSDRQDKTGRHSFQISFKPLSDTNLTNNEKFYQNLTLTLSSLSSTEGFCLFFKLENLYVFFTLTSLGPSEIYFIVSDIPYFTGLESCQCSGCSGCLDKLVVLKLVKMLAARHKL